MANKTTKITVKEYKGGHTEIVDIKKISYSDLVAVANLCAAEAARRRQAIRSRSN